MALAGTPHRHQVTAERNRGFTVHRRPYLLFMKETHHVRIAKRRGKDALRNVYVEQTRMFLHDLDQWLFKHDLVSDVTFKSSPEMGVVTVTATVTVMRRIRQEFGMYVVPNPA